MIKKIYAIITLSILPFSAFSQTLDPALQWKFNGYQSRGQPNGLGSLNSDGSIDNSISDGLISSDPGTLYSSDSVDICKSGDTLPDGSTVDDSTKNGQLYSVDDILYLNDGSIIQLTSVGSNGTLVSGGWNYIKKGLNSTDPLLTPSLKYTVDVTKNNSNIRNSKSTSFKPGCIAVLTSSTPLTSVNVTQKQATSNTDNATTIVPDTINNPDGAWVGLLGLLNNVSSSGGTFHMATKSRLPINWSNNNISPIPINEKNYNLIKITMDGSMFGSNVTSPNPEWNGTTFPVGAPESALVESFSPRWGNVYARNYTDDNIYNFVDNAYRRPAPIATYNYIKHVDDSAQLAKACATYPAWQASKSYSYNDMIYWQKDANNAFMYSATVAGTSGSTSPQFTGAETSNIKDGSVTWTLIGQSNDHRNPLYSNYGWCDGDNNRGMGNSVINYFTDSNSGTGTTVITNTFNSSGKNGWGGFDIDQYNTILQTGTNWTWVEVNQLSEVGSIGIGYNDPDNNNNWAYSGKMNYVEEWNLSGIGKDDPKSYYDPRSSNRIVWWFSPWQNGGLTWSANSTVGQQQILIVTDPSGQDWMYTAKDDCTEGSTQPSWKFNETTTITDGTCKWVFDGKRRFQIGRFIGIDKNHGSNEEIEYGTLMGSESVIYNSIFDFSTVTFTDDVSDGIHSLIRSPSNTFWDMSADGTRTGQNNHLLGLSTAYGNHLSYDTKDSNGNIKQVFGIRDSGIIMKSINIISASGSSITDATTTPNTSIVVVNNGTGGVKLTSDLYQPGSSQTIVNETNSDIKVYPIDTGWSIMTNSAGSPYTVSSGKSVEFIYSGQNNNFVTK